MGLGEQVRFPSLRYETSAALEAKFLEGALRCQTVNGLLPGGASRPDADPPELRKTDDYLHFSPFPV